MQFCVFHKILLFNAKYDANTLEIEPEIGGDKTWDCCKTLKRPDPSLPVGDTGLITTISTHHSVVPTFYFELKLIRAYLCW